MLPGPNQVSFPLHAGRYVVYAPIAAGGMATVHLGRLVGPVGFSRTVAVKRMHAQYAQDPEFVAMFLDEARLAARIRHPNVIPTLDVVAEGGEIFLVMEYVPGESLAKLSTVARRKGVLVDGPVLVALIVAVLHGLHAAHEARDERGEPLGIVHRDMSPQNVLVGADGAPRVLDFGIAKAAGRIHNTKDHTLKGKLAYMAPEQLRSDRMDRRADIYAIGVMLWELVVGRRLYGDASEAQIVAAVLSAEPAPVSSAVASDVSQKEQAAHAARVELATKLEPIITKAMSREPAARHATALELAEELSALPLATSVQIARFVSSLAGDALAAREAVVAEVERGGTPASLEALIAALQSTPSLADSGETPHSGIRSDAPTARDWAQEKDTETITTGMRARRAAEAAQGVAPASGPHAPEGALVSPMSFAPDAPPRRRWPVALAVIVGLLFGGLVIGAFVAGRRAGGRVDGDPTTPSGSAAAAPSGSAAAAPSGSAASEGAPPAPSTSTGSVGAPGPSASAAAAPASASRSGKRGPRPPPRRVPTAAPSRPAAPPSATTKPASCDPPYYVDKQGIRRLRKECL